MPTQSTQHLALLTAALLALVAFAMVATNDSGLSLAPAEASAQVNDDGVTNLNDSETSVLTPAILYGLLIVVAVAAIAILVVYRKRRSTRPQDDEQDGPLTSVADREHDEHVGHPR